MSNSTRNTAMNIVKACSASVHSPLSIITTSFPASTARQRCCVRDLRVRRVLAQSQVHGICDLMSYILRIIIIKYNISLTINYDKLLRSQLFVT